ncbi:hypothetical protein [Kribbella jiaozuonensis]|nr:hypothetical protein [Kribbella jiaozuonensis]
MQELRPSEFPEAKAVTVLEIGTNENAERVEDIVREGRDAPLQE